jgi:hypothetical protein
MSKEAEVKPIAELVAQAARVCEARGHGGLWPCKENCIVCGLAEALESQAERIAESEVHVTLLEGVIHEHDLELTRGYTKAPATTPLATTIWCEPTREREEKDEQSAPTAEKGKPMRWTMTTPGYGYAYAWRNGPRWSLDHLRHGRILGFLRTLWFTLVLGHISESCQECGRPYLLWWADNELYDAVTGLGARGGCSPGLFCLDCFDRKARKQGVTLRWKPEIHE